MAATDVYLIRKNQQWVKFSAVLDVTVTGPTTSDEVEVWSGEYRDIFSSAVTVAGVNNPSSLSGPGIYTAAETSTQTTSQVPAPQTQTDNLLTVTAGSSESDEVAHVDLRQTALKRTCWKFDYGASATPRYGYAFIMDGDVIANNPPETV